MRLRLTLTAGLAVIIAAVGVAAVSAATHHRRMHPRISVLSTNPITIHGRDFRHGARVRVTLDVLSARTGADRQMIHRVRANRHGAFTTSFAISTDRCSSYTVKASGAHGAPVTVRGPKPQCAPLGPGA